MIEDSRPVVNTQSAEGDPGKRGSRLGLLGAFIPDPGFPEQPQ